MSVLSYSENMIRFKALIFLSGLLFSSFVYGQTTKDANNFAQSMIEGKYGKAYKQFDKSARKKIKRPMLGLIWKGVTKQYGDVQAIGDFKKSQSGKSTVFSAPLRFENIGLNLVLSYGKSGKLSGFTFTALDYQVPEYATNIAFGTEKLTVTTDTFELPAEVVLPNNCIKCPIVILVHGSGASDKDEGSRLSPNKVFRDLAYGFAVNGIASLRYDKRTYVYRTPESYTDSMTIYDETIYDALSAIRLAKSLDYVDTNNVFVLGHSLGAYAAPLIAKAGKPKGIIMMAGPYRPLFEIIPEQYEFLFNRDSNLTKKEETMIQTARAEIELIYGRETTVDSLSVLGQSSMMRYYQQMISYDPAEVVLENAEEDGIRTLIIQGDRDYQVRNETEFATYEQKLAKTPRVDLKLVHGLNHQMINGESPSSPDEYFEPANVDIEAIRYMADWMKRK